MNMGDLIDRQAAIDCCRNEWEEEVAERIEALPSVQLLDIARDIATIIENEKDMRVMLQQQWIPVTERLPEYGTEVVTINKDDEYKINHVIDEEDGEWFFDGAVAWMPLPEPYKGEEE